MSGGVCPGENVALLRVNTSVSVVSWTIHLCFGMSTLCHLTAPACLPCPSTPGAYLSINRRRSLGADTVTDINVDAQRGNLEMPR